ncbi:MAG: SDR family oxidoreductase [Xanthomonadales bacterium]|jgi:NAD(P)-dependent dehydrogenase (short-subunit alcohol dehydrogenase family)|nr:SDR family oxidoreductase [Xanthomonadales bacterium]
MKYVIFGGAGGVGSALARKLVERGEQVFLVGRSEDKLTALSNEIGAGYAVADVTDPEGVQTALASLDGEIAGLAYAVGTIGLKPLQRVTREDMIQAYDVNVVGAVSAIQAVRDKLVEGGGIVLFSSVAAQRGFNNHLAVAGAKGALEAICRTLAAELAPKARVNAIAMSLTDTPLAKELTANEKIREGVARAHPLRRLGRPEEVAALASHLLSGDAAWTTGAVFNLDGGRGNLA